MNKHKRFAQLLELYVSGNISADEHAELFDLLATHEYDEFLGKSIIRDLKEPGWSAADLPPHLAEDMIRNIIASEKTTSRMLPVKKTQRRLPVRWMVAASIVFLISIGSYFLFAGNSHSRVNSAFKAFIPANNIVQNNDDNSQQQILTLEDGTKVTLQPHSSLHYPQQFSTDKREVFLEGEAFFEVAKNPSRPFLVYYNNIVTRVLGTSFRMNTNAQTGDIEVAVKTGRVQVYENDKLMDGKLNKAVILTPNQKVVYKPANRLFETQLVEKPEPLTDEKNIQPEPFVYDQEKLLNVFRHIESKYGIEIVLENTRLNDCLFTGDVSSQDLYTKLKIICLTTNASYEINGTRILIKGEGCN
jgi:transmembrane sensor